MFCKVSTQFSFVLRGLKLINSSIFPPISRLDLDALLYKKRLCVNPKPNARFWLPIKLLWTGQCLVHARFPANTGEEISVRISNDHSVVSRKGSVYVWSVRLIFLIARWTVDCWLSKSCQICQIYPGSRLWRCLSNCVSWSQVFKSRLTELFPQSAVYLGFNLGCACNLQLFTSLINWSIPLKLGGTKFKISGIRVDI